MRGRVVITENEKVQCENAKYIGHELGKEDKLESYGKSLAYNLRRYEAQ